MVSFLNDFVFTSFEYFRRVPFELRQLCRIEALWRGVGWVPGPHGGLRISLALVQLRGKHKSDNALLGPAWCA